MPKTTVPAPYNGQRSAAQAADRLAHGSNTASAEQQRRKRREALGPLECVVMWPLQAN